MMDHGKYLLVAAVCMTAGAWAKPVDQKELSRLVPKLDKLHQVTETPHAMADSTAALCRLAFNTNIDSVLDGPSKRVLDRGTSIHASDAIRSMRRPIV